MNPALSVNKASGYTCVHWGRFAKFSAWLFAQGAAPIIHTCECGARNEIIGGRPVRLIPPRGFYLATGCELDALGERYGIPRIGRPMEPDATYRERILSELSSIYPTWKGK